MSHKKDFSAVHDEDITLPRNVGQLYPHLLRYKNFKIHED